MTYPITHIDGLGEDEVKKLKSVGIRTTERLLEAAKSPKGRRLLAASVVAAPVFDGLSQLPRVRCNSDGMATRRLMR